MKRSLLLLAVLSLALPALADEHDEDDGPEQAREIEVKVRHGGPGDGGGPGGELDDDGPMGGGRGRGMKRMFVSKEHRGHMDPAFKEAGEKIRAAGEKVRAVKSKARDAKDGDKAALKKEAKAAVGELFDAKLAMEQAMLDRMGKHLTEKKERLAKRKASRERLVSEKTDQLIGDAPSWDD